MEATVMSFLDKIDGVLGGVILMYGLLGAGIFITIYLGFPQVKYLGRGFKNVFGGLFDKKAASDDEEKGSLSSFQALATAIAAQVGTGNVAGVATAITAGGPGAVFWMWMSGLLGMGTIFAEAILAQKYRQRTSDGELVGGPAYYISEGLGKKNKTAGKFMAGFFAVAIIFALGLVGNMVQSNSIADAMSAAFPISQLVVGIVVAVLAGLIVIGGMSRIGAFAELVVPVMAVVYIAGAIVIMIKFRANLGSVFTLIFKSAFSGNAVMGGIAGVAMKEAVKLGVQRGLFSNEAGMGSTPHAHAVARVDHPVEQGMTAMVGVVIDTLIVCTGTAMTILATGAYDSLDASGSFFEGAALTQEAFRIAFGTPGQMFLAICLAFFAFTTILGWYYFGESNIRYLFGSKALMPYRLLVLACIVFGSFQKVALVWKLSDVFNSLMVIPNIIAIIFLIREVKDVFEDYKKCDLEGRIYYDYEV